LLICPLVVNDLWGLSKREVNGLKGVGEGGREGGKRQGERGKTASRGEPGRHSYN